MSASIAVVDDEARMVEIVSMLLRRDGHEVRGFTEPEAFLESLEREPVDLLLTDLRMPRMDGVEVLRRARAELPGLPVILFTAHATVQTAIEAMKEGAYDYLQKPFDNDEMKALVRRALEHSRLARENRLLRRGGADVVAESDAMKRVMALLRRVAPSRSTVLITGESGTGKEVAAKALHASSDRADGPLVALNVKALGESVLESELFGHEKGAFTGADRSKPGVFERADGGTLLLDEIGEISASFQAKLLRVLQEREILPVGGTEARPVDVRLVAATNRDLEAEVREGRFREDLFFRLNVIPVHLPPLRERPADVLPLARRFLAKQSHALERQFDGWTEEAERWMLAHDWPGNVRELENAIERGALLADGRTLALSDLTLKPSDPEGETWPTDLGAFVERATAEHVRRVLGEVEGKRVEAARRLGIDRTTLYRLMRKHGIE